MTNVKNHSKIFIITVIFISATAKKESFPKQQLWLEIIAAAALGVLSFCASEIFVTFYN